MEIKVTFDPERITGQRDARIYGHFIEHFHNQIYGGIFNPGSPLSDEEGFRTDVLDAWKRVSILLLSGGPADASYPLITERTASDRKGSRISTKLGG